VKIIEINFACKTFPINNVLKCSFGLTTTEFEVLKILLKKNESSVDEIATLLGKNRTTIQRSIKPLINKNLIKRKQYNLDGGGYQYYYSPAHKEEIKKRIRNEFQSFTEKVTNEIEKW